MPLIPSSRRGLDWTLLRDVNKHIADVAWATDQEIFTLLCECSNPFCVRQVTISRLRFDEMAQTREPLLAYGHQIERSPDEP